MTAEDHRAARTVAVIAATCISLACGTNYAYSAWAPQFAQKLQLSSTQTNIIGAMGNMGMYATGIPVGLLVDGRGPRGAILIGGACLALGYFPLKTAFDAGAGATNIVLLCFFSFLTGTGSCAAFSASIKAAALNWPHHRGTATGLPLAAFGLSALFFTTISHFAFPDNTSDYLLLLSIGTAVLVFGSFPFIRVPESSKYTALATDDVRPSSKRRDSNRMHKHRAGQILNQPDTSKPIPSTSSSPVEGPSQLEPAARDPNVEQEADEHSSLMSEPGDVDDDEEELKHNERHLHHLDISGFAILKHIEFYQLFFLLGSLTGVGLMTINNIGNNAQALWAHFDPTVPASFIAQRQLMHVSIISTGSFLGRLASGIGSDYLVKTLHLSRFWCIVASSTVFLVTQLLGTQIEHPNYLFVLSSLTGLGYGALFGVYPALVADAFGVHGLSLNWGCMILSPVIFGNVFNVAYGAIYDSHSVVVDEGHRECHEGLDCYRSAYWITFAGAALGLVLSLWSIQHEHKVKRKMEIEGRDEHHA